MMSKKIKIHPSTGMVIRFNGIFDIDSLYKNTKSWFSKNSYDYFEKENTEKFKPEGNSIKIIMKASREVDDYVKFEIEVHFVEITKVKKVDKGYYGEARIVIRCNMILDYHESWKAVTFLFYLYNQIILKKKILYYYWPKAYNEMMDLNTTIKTNLGLVK